MNSPEKKTVKGLYWTSIETFGNKGVTFIIGIIIARILDPKDFGIIGMANIFIIYAQILLVSGFTTALIQKKDIKDTDYSTVFVFNIFFGLFIYMIFFLLARPISIFFNNPNLISVIKILSLSILFNSLIIVQDAYLTRNMNFKLLAKIKLIAVLISAIGGLLGAYLGIGYWALVLQICLNSFIRAILLWLFSKWKPSFIFSKIAFLSLYKYAFNLLSISLVKNIFDYIYELIIGKFFPVQQLGYYTKSKQLQQFPVNNIFFIISKSTFPYFSLMQNEREKLNSVFEKSIKLLILLMFPVMALLYILSHEIIHLLLTDKWLPSVPYFKILCLAGMFIPLSALIYNVLNAVGNPRKTLWLVITEKLIISLSIILTFKGGILAMLNGYYISIVLSLFISLYFLCKIQNISFIKLTKNIFFVFAIVTVLGLLFNLIKSYLDFKSELLIITIISFLFLLNYTFIIYLSKLFPYNLKSLIYNFKKS